MNHPAWNLRTKLYLSLGGLFFILLVGSVVKARSS